MLRSIRAAFNKRRKRKTKIDCRRMFVESLEQRQLLAVTPLLSLGGSDPGPMSAKYGPVQDESTFDATIRLQAEGEGAANSEARQLLFAGIAGATASPTNAGLLTVIDATSPALPHVIVPWNSSVINGGINGLAFDSSGRLYAAADQGPCTPSELVELNPMNGAVIRRMPIKAGDTEINIGDLAIEPGTGRLFGIRSVHDVANRAGELFLIDVNTGAATLLGDTGVDYGEGLAFAADGALYLAGLEAGKPVLYKIDPETAEPHQRDAATGRAVPFVALNDPTGRLKRVEGLAGHPHDGTLIATSGMTRFAANQIVDDTYSIDLSTGRVTVQPLASPARGIFGDVAFQPNSRALEIVYQESFEQGLGGFVIDNTGGTLPGLWHSSLGRRFDSLPSHTPLSSVYYGAFETAFGGGHYVLPLDHQGVLTSPAIQLPTASVLSFNYLLDTRSEVDVDFVTVSVIAADGTTTEILSRADGTLPQTGSQQWRTATADLSAFACQPVRLQFSFDTGPVPQIDPEGWYLDDVLIASTGGLCDFGDAADDPANVADYPTRLASGGARHGVVPGFSLGEAIDTEPDGQPTATADGDDNQPPAGPDDEDGVTWISLDPTRLEPLLFVGQQGQAVVQLTNQTANDALLDAWIDFNQDGDWNDAGEQIAASQALAPGANSLTFPVPTDASLGGTFARFRLSSTGGLTPSGLALDGEVEDYTVSIAPATDFAIDKRDDGTEAVAGTNYTYTIEVTNQGPSASTGAEVTDTLPPGWRFIGSSNGSCVADSGSSQTVRCDVASLSVGEATTFTITVAVPPDALPGTVTNSVTVVPNEFDPNPGDNTATEDTDVIRVTDFAIDKRDDGSDAVAGREYTYTIEITNSGPSDSSGASFADTLPAGWSFAASSNASCVEDGSNPNQVACEIEALAVGESVSFTITTAVPPSALPGTVTNTALVTPNEGDPKTATEDTDVVRVTDFAIEKRDDGSDAVPGQQYSYTIDVSNQGPSDSSGAVVTDTLPAGWTFVAASGAVCQTAASTTGMVTCDLAPLAVGSSRSFTMTVRVPDDAAPGVVTNRVTVTPHETDPNLDDNTATEDTDVVALVSVRGRVYADVNGNARQDGVEAGLAFVTLQLFEDTNRNGLRDDAAAAREETTSADGSYEFIELTPGAYIVEVVNATVPTGFQLTTGTHSVSIAMIPASGAVVDFGYQAIVQFVTPLGAYRSDLPDDLVVPFVRPASDPLGDLLRDPSRALDTILPSYLPYQSVTITNTSGAVATITEVNPIIDSASIATDHFITVYTQAQLDRLAELELDLDGHFAAGQPIPASLRDELRQLLAGVTAPATQIPPLPAGEAIELFLVYRPVRVETNATGAEVVTAQLADWSPDAPPEHGAAHTFSRSDHLQVVTSAGAALQYQLVGGSTYDSDIADHNGSVGLDDFALVNALIAQRWPVTPGEPLWDPTTDANVRYPNSADGILDSRFWPNVLVQEGPALREAALGDFGVFNVELTRNARAPFLDLNAGADAIGVDHTATIAREDLASGTTIASDDVQFANSPFLELERLTVVLTNALDGEAEQLDVTTGGTDIVVVENRIENGRRILVLSHAAAPGIPETVSSYLTVLKTIRYSNQSASPTPGVRIFEIQAIGTAADFSFMKGGVQVSQAAGNVAISRLTF